MGDIALYRSKEMLSMELNNIVSWGNYEENNVTYWTSTGEKDTDEVSLNDLNEFTSIRIIFVKY